MAETQTDDAPAVTAKHDDAGNDPLVGEHGSLTAWAVTINKPASELYAFWRDFSNLPRFMDNIVSITCADTRTSHWVVKAPAGKTVEWDATVTEEQEGRLIAWSADDNADVPNSGRVEFRDAGTRGTVVTATISYDPPAGAVGKLVAKLFQREPRLQARRDLRRFKQLMETGEVATSSWTNAQHEEETA